MIRVTDELALRTSSRLSERDRQIIRAVGMLGLVSAQQLERLFWIGGDPKSRGRMRRRCLARLVALGVLARLERQIGGIRAGSSGYVYSLDRLGLRLYRPEQAGRLRSPEEPGLLFIRHALAVAELYVAIHEAERAGKLELLSWESEPACHRSFAAPLGARLILKPDASARIGISAYADSYFFELDTGSHRRGAVVRKLDAYLAYFKSGREQADHGIFPKVLWVATTAEGAERLRGWIDRLPLAHQRLFAVTTSRGFVDFLTAEEATS